MEYVILNGKAVKTDQVVIDTNNRAFRYGDGFFESFLCNGIEPFLFDRHYKRIVAAASALKIDVPLLPPEDNLRKQIALLISKKKYPPYSRVRITFYRTPGGLYTPQSSTPQWVIDHEPYTNKPFEYTPKGILTGIYEGEQKMASQFSAFKTCSSLLFVMAGMDRQTKSWDDIIIMNHKGRLIEGLSSNLFWIKNGTIYTPSIDTGCVDGVMRGYVMDVALSMGYSIIETEGIPPAGLSEVDEAFLTNTTQGIRSILGINGRRFFISHAPKIAQDLRARLMDN